MIPNIDSASGYQIVAPAASKHPRVVGTAFTQCWGQWAGMPDQVLTDMGGEFDGTEPRRKWTRRFTAHRVPRGPLGDGGPCAARSLG